MHESLWQRIDAALDARRDPFDDPDLTHELQQDPEAVAQVRRLMMRLDVLSNDPTLVSPTHPLRRLRPAAAGVAAALLCFAVLRTGAVSLVAPRNHPNATSARTIETVSLIVEHVTPPPARGERVVLESRRVVGWTLEGNTP